MRENQRDRLHSLAAAPPGAAGDGPRPRRRSLGLRLLAALILAGGAGAILGRFGLQWPALALTGLGLAATVGMVVAAVRGRRWPIAAMPAFLVGLLTGATLRGGWAGRWAGDSLTLVCGGVGLACLVLAYMLLLAMGRLGLRRPGGQAGSAAVEFVLVFPVGMILALILAQAVLVMVGNLTVHYAAFNAARAAIVALPMKISLDETRNVYLGSGSLKHERIREAAAYSLIPVSGDGANVPAGNGTGSATDAATVVEAMDRFHQLYGMQTPNWVPNLLANKFRYALDYTEVRLEPPAQPPAYGDHEDIEVHVDHTLFMSVPIGNRIFGTQIGNGYYGAPVTATCTLSNQGMEDEIDVEQFPRAVGRGGI